MQFFLPQLKEEIRHISLFEILCWSNSTYVLHLLLIEKPKWIGDDVGAMAREIKSMLKRCGRGPLEIVNGSNPSYSLDLLLIEKRRWIGNNAEAMACEIVYVEEVRKWLDTSN